MTAAVSANGHPLIYQHIPGALRTIGLRMNRLIQLFFCAPVDFFLILVIGNPQLLQIPPVISSPHLGHFTHISLTLLITYIHQHPWIHILLFALRKLSRLNNPCKQLICSDQNINPSRINPNHFHQRFVSICQILSARISLLLPKRISSFIPIEHEQCDFINSFSFKRILCMPQQFRRNALSPAILRNC